MMLWKAWTDVRARFYLCAILMTLLIAPTVVVSAVHSASAAATAQGTPASPQETWPQDEESGGWQGLEAYSTAANDWAHGMEHVVLAILAVVLSVGGTLSQTNARSNLMTLSLPSPRWKWLVAHWIVMVALTLLLALWISVIFAGAGVMAGLPVPWKSLALAWIASGLSGALWIWPGMLSTSFTREAVRAALIVVGVMVAARTVTVLGGLPGWTLQNLADLRQWDGQIPWRPLLLGLGLTGISAWWVLRRFERTDF